MNIARIGCAVAAIVAAIVFCVIPFRKANIERFQATPTAVALDTNSQVAIAAIESMEKVSIEAQENITDVSKTAINKISLVSMVGNASQALVAFAIVAGMLLALGLIMRGGGK